MLLILISSTTSTATNFYDAWWEEEKGKEKFEQPMHYLWGYYKTLVYMALGDDPCTAKQKTMDFAIWREFNQKSTEKQQEGRWCKLGCRRDLDYWQRGVDSAAFSSSEKKAVKCKIKEWKPPGHLPDVERPLLPIYKSSLANLKVVDPYQQKVVRALVGFDFTKKNQTCANIFDKYCPEGSVREKEQCFFRYVMGPKGRSNEVAYCLNIDLPNGQLNSTSRATEQK